MKNIIVATRFLLAAVAGAALLALGLGGCQSTASTTPTPQNPGPHSHADGKDVMVGNPGPHS